VLTSLGAGLSWTLAFAGLGTALPAVGSNEVDPLNSLKMLDLYPAIQLHMTEVR